jgi:hypothetical protein
LPRGFKNIVTTTHTIPTEKLLANF